MQLLGALFLHREFTVSRMVILHVPGAGDRLPFLVEPAAESRRKLVLGADVSPRHILANDLADDRWRSSTAIQGQL